MDAETKSTALSYLSSILQDLAGIFTCPLHSLYICATAYTTPASSICQTTIIAMNTKFENQTTPSDPFDTDSNISGFGGIQGLAGYKSWNWEDDNGQSHKTIQPKLYCEHDGQAR